MRKHRNSYIQNRKTVFDEDDTCVLCGGKTGFKRSDPIQQRVHYIEGAGQPCESCYRGTYQT